MQNRKNNGMLKNTRNLSEVKEYVKTCGNSRIRVNVNLGRNKSLTFSGVLSGVYPALFTVLPDEKIFSEKRHTRIRIFCAAR